ncbi:hypothetical protein LZ31DRAFT_51489 [Colletotrichum somersetense]|nr:hypothetical protein LZ31DRAFT_51489 [Colletotrichum somersetense]
MVIQDKTGALFRKSSNKKKLIKKNPPARNCPFRHHRQMRYYVCCFVASGLPPRPRPGPIHPYGLIAWCAVLCLLTPVPWVSCPRLFFFFFFCVSTTTDSRGLGSRNTGPSPPSAVATSTQSIQQFVADLFSFATFRWWQSHDRGRQPPTKPNPKLAAVCDFACPAGKTI